jgi:hypothetical protein
METFIATTSWNASTSILRRDKRGDPLHFHHPSDP